MDYKEKILCPLCKEPLTIRDNGSQFYPKYRGQCRNDKCLLYYTMYYKSVERLANKVNSLPTEKEIAKDVIEEYVEVGLPIKYNEGAPVGWENGIAYKHELSILKDCVDWLDKEAE